MAFNLFVAPILASIAWGKNTKEESQKSVEIFYCFFAILSVLNVINFLCTIAPIVGFYEEIKDSCG